MTLTINKPIAVLFLIVVPVLGGTLIFIAKKAHPHFIKVFDEYDNLNNLQAHRVSGAMTAPTSGRSTMARSASASSAFSD